MDSSGKENQLKRMSNCKKLQEASRQRILPPAEPEATPASGRTAGELARLFQQSANFSAPAGADPKFLSPTAASAPAKAPKRPRSTPSQPPAERLQSRHVPTLPEILSAQPVDMDAYERAAAHGQGAQWVHDNMIVPFRADDANKATLALMRHNERVQQQAQRLSKAESAAEAKESQAGVDGTRRYSPTTTARLARAAKARGAQV
jgi:hypothetical protein